MYRKGRVKAKAQEAQSRGVFRQMIVFVTGEVFLLVRKKRQWFLSREGIMNKY